MQARGDCLSYFLCSLAALTAFRSWQNSLSRIYFPFSAPLIIACIEFEACSKSFKLKCRLYAVRASDATMQLQRMYTKIGRG